MHYSTPPGSQSHDPNNMRTALLFPLCLLCTFQAFLAKDILNAGQNITGTTSVLTSAGQRFVLGFFSPLGRPKESYLGIWYNQSQYPGTQTVVWVANRDNPVVGSNIGVFQIADDGNLVVTDTTGQRYWSSTQGSTSTNMTVKLKDSGNLALLQYDQMGKSVTVFQSFHHPTDTFLPGMKMYAEIKLTSWSSDNDPGSGIYTFMMAPTGDNRYIILKNYQPYWERGKNLSSGSMFETVAYLLNNFSMSTDTDPSPARNGSRYMNYDNTRLVMKSTGELQFLTWDGFQGDWSVRWRAPDSICDVHNACGHFTSCNVKNNVTCKCLPGFRRVGEEGCARRSATASCGEGATRYLTLVMVKTGIPDEMFPAENETECKQMCHRKCQECQAYSYAASTSNHSSVSSCWIWTQDLDTLQEEYLDDEEDDYGRNLSVRVDISDIAPTPRTCDPCGTNMVPYPLSTGPSCGDPMYFNFSCNHSTGQLSLSTSTSSDTHKVTSMDVESRKFVIQVDSLNTYCDYNRSSSDETLQIRFPFSVTNDCLDEDEVEVTWQPPSEPICTESVDCEGWKHSNCKAARAGAGKRCLCDTNYRWDGVSLECTKASEGNSKSQISLILGITLTSVLILICAIIFAYICRRKITRKKDKENNERNREQFYDSTRHVKDLIEMEGLEEHDNEGIEVPYFDFESIIVATDNFSNANKLGQGGYGPVYKGKLRSGEDVAVKRLSSVSSQGSQEFKNEIVLISKLQHRNLVKLRGYCIKGNEKILLYEYMHNKSLDSFIFDPTQSVLLHWQMRFDIILGVARGLLYLHQDSRLRVIHRDLKTSNILLDEEMQPKISDFGLAKLVRGKETEADTNRVVGTHGYMSPEYALDGLLSTKSDVFSFGVVMLEIISGKKNKGFYQSDQFSSLSGYAWRLWEENKLLDLMDISLRESCNANQFIRCAHIGLLCVQDEPSDRPTMSIVVALLVSETATIPTPKQPTFFGSRGLSTTTSSSKPEISMQFDSSIQEGR